MFQAGELDRQITVRVPQYQNDEFGDIVHLEPKCYTVWANRDDIDNFDNKEIEKANMVIATGRTDFTIRYASWINERCDVVDKLTNDVFEILSVSVIGRQERQVLRTRRKDNLR